MQRDLPARPQQDSAAGQSEADLASENAELRRRLHEAEDTLHALRNGEIDAIIVGDDIYTLEAAEAAANRFRSDVLAQMEDAVVAMDADHHVIYLNPAAERQYGFRTSEALGLPREKLFTLEWLAPNDEAESRRCLEEVGHWRGRQRHLTRDGRSPLVDVTWSRLQELGIADAGSLMVIRDVSVRAAAEAAARDSRVRLDFALESARIGEWEIDLATDAARRSLQHDQCFGYTEPVAEWTPAIFLSHVHRDDRDWVAEVFQRTREQRGQMHFDCRVVWADGSIHWIEVHGSVFDQEFGPGRMLGTVADISERKRIEAALRDADRRKDEFLATLAHELRNPLAPIRNSIHIMRQSKQAEAHERAQAVIERQLDQLVHLVDDLLDVGRISQGKIELRRELIDIATLVENAVDTCAPLIDSRGHRLKIELPEQPITIDADMTRMTQVVANLLNNAAKYTPPGGDITLRVAPEAAGMVAISVTDTGIGIPAEMLPQVFEMFTQVNRTLDRSQGGLGIGLALVKQLVLMHGGSVEGHSEGENRGATVTVRLPVVILAGGSPAQPAPRETASASEAESNTRILVVDDNNDVADSLVELLRLVGYTAELARDGEQALEAAEAWHPDVVLLDIGLPTISGREVAKRLRERPWADGLLLIALTGWGQFEDRRLSLEAGFDDHLVKPVDLDRLLDVLRRFDKSATA
ncbi:ATP-binding protein [Piscinibacter sakaiensis]|uniref:PAS domain-containing hybrid sensor histidine kinase/response regulator n=1 Tax=Piscinibacter sakaiensis TaxID=1547922 RepID=UPI003AAB8507